MAVYLNFPCLTGVRQVKFCYPFFLQYVWMIWDLKKKIDEKCLETIQSIFHDQFHIHFELFVLLYTDDTVIISESKDNMQKVFGYLSVIMWPMEVNSQRRKWLIRHRNRCISFVNVYEMKKSQQTYSFSFLIQWKKKKHFIIWM